MGFEHMLAPTSDVHCIRSAAILKRRTANATWNTTIKLGYILNKLNELVYSNLFLIKIRNYLAFIKKQVLNF